MNPPAERARLTNETVWLQQSRWLKPDHHLFSRNAIAGSGARHDRGDEAGFLAWGWRDAHTKVSGPFALKDNSGEGRHMIAPCGRTQMIEVVSTIAGCRAEVRKTRSSGLTIGLVPTMGALHEGHLSLVRQSQADCDLTVVSIFVNPLQFGPKEDFTTYPRDLDADVRVLSSLERGPILVLAPSENEMYPSELLTFVGQTTLGDHLCGPFRPGHFRGVLTVVLKLFEIVQPDRAYFGKKDYQQWRVVGRMVSDLNVPVDVIGMPTVREADGLAMSSRNRYLSPEERRKALCLYRALLAGRARIRDGEKKAGRIAEAMRQTVAEIEGVAVDYLSVVDPWSLQPVENVEGTVLLAGAVRVGRTRLIDNLEVGSQLGSEGASPCRRTSRA